MIVSAPDQRSPHTPDTSCLTPPSTAHSRSALACAELASSEQFPTHMGHSSSKVDWGSSLTPQSSASRYRRNNEIPSIVSVLNNTYSKNKKQESYGNAKSPSSWGVCSDRGAMILSPVLSNDSQLSTNSALSNSSITANYTLVDPTVNVSSSENFSPLLSLPIEILYQIIEIVYYDESTNSISANLEKFSKTVPILSKTFNQLAIRFLYKYAIFNRPNSFDRFLSNIMNQPDIGHYVEFMDFQTFTSIGLGRTGRMNQEIQMVTAHTIQLALKACPNLIEFQASENIQDDLDANVLSTLFNHMPKIQALDFCGASSAQFAAAFDELRIEQEDASDMESVATCASKSSSSLNQLFKISFHDCSKLPLRVFEKLLPHFIHLHRLDLTHTSITSKALLTYLPETCRLTHLSLARCSKLTTKDLIHFLTKHPAVTGGSLQWLNLQIDSNVVSPLTEQYLNFTLSNLKAPDLRYLNLGGMPVTNRILNIIKNSFPNLESLAISHANVDMSDLLHLLEDSKAVKFLDITSCKGVDRRTLLSFLKTSLDSALEALEFDYKVLYDLTGGQHIVVHPVQTDFSVSSTTHLPVIWKFYDNEGRRAFIYKIGPEDPEYDSLISGKPSNSNNSSNVIYYDLETGAKVETKVTKPKFLIYASRKINCSIGYYNLNTTKKKKYLSGEIPESVWPVEFSQRGIYNYYSLNVK